MSDVQPPGHFRCYIPKKFGEVNLAVIGQANKIITSYESKGYSLTVRQIFYQFVAHDLFPDDRKWRRMPGTDKWMRDPNGTKNATPNYTFLGSLLSDARMAGLVSWTALEDRGRSLMGLRCQDSPASAIKATKEVYRIDKWAGQPWRPEVWVEKQAMEGVIGTTCNRLQVDFYATKGYNSQSEQWRAGQRFASYYEKGQTPIVFHLADHDPSGIDMTNDNRERLKLFAGVPVLVQRLALNKPQIDLYNPPPNPAKETDSRFVEYEKLYGSESWELDALSPEVISDTIEKAIVMIRDQPMWDAMVEQEVDDKRVLDMMIEELGDR